MRNPEKDATVLAIEKPHQDLWTYYLISSLAFFIFFPIPAVVLRFKFQTLRYRFTDEGISMSWGILFRRETIINYARIQDIHLRSNLTERWLGLVSRGWGGGGAPSGSAPPPPAGGGESPDLAGALLEVARELRETRQLLESRAASRDGGPDRV